MADLDFDVLMQGLAQQRELLASLSTNANDKANIRNKINATIKGFRDQYEAAKTEKEKAAICDHVADVANHLAAAGAATGALVQAVQSGDPFAISAATLTLATAGSAILCSCAAWARAATAAGTGAASTTWAGTAAAARMGPTTATTRVRPTAAAAGLATG